MTDFVIRRVEEKMWGIVLIWVSRSATLLEGRDYVPEKVAAFAENALQNPYKLYLVSENENGVTASSWLAGLRCFTTMKGQRRRGIVGAKRVWNFVTMMGFFKEWEIKESKWLFAVLQLNLSCTIRRQME